MDKKKHTSNPTVALAPTPAERHKKEKDGARALSPGDPKHGKSIHTTSTPINKERASYRTFFFTEEEWEKRVHHINSLNPKEKSREKQKLLQHFKLLLPNEGTDLKQENLESTVRSLYRYYYLTRFIVSTITATREDTKQLEDMKEIIREVRKDLKNFPACFGVSTTEKDFSVAEEELPKHEEKTLKHTSALEEPPLKPQATSTGKDEMEHFVHQVEKMDEEEKRKLFGIATNNFLTLYKKEVEHVLETNSAPEGFNEIFEQLEKSYNRIGMLFESITQTEKEQRDMRFVRIKYYDVKDHIAMLHQKEEDELLLDEEPDPEVESILYEINEFANNPDYNCNSELAHLICDWISQGGGAMKHYQGSELPELLLSFGKNRIEHVLHLWRSRLCETQSETHQQISHYLNNILEMWDDLEPEGESSIWAAHKSRFTRGNIPNVTLNDKFSIFLDQVTEEREDSLTWDYDDTNTSQQRNENPSQGDHTQQQSNIPHGGFRRIPAFVNHLPSVGGRANVAHHPSTVQQQQSASTDVDAITRLADILEKKNMNTGNHHSAMKLPSIQIGKFDGNPLNWVNWWPKYKALIHKRTDLDDSTKFLYLQSFITDKAAKELWGAGPQTLPYNKAIDILFEKFADNELLTGVYRDQLKKIPFPKSAKDIPGIRNFVDEVKKYMNCLRVYKQTPEEYSLATMDFYRAYMPEELLHFIADKENKRISHLNLEYFISALSKYADLREDTSRFREHAVGRNQNPYNPATTMTTKAGTFSKTQSGTTQAYPANKFPANFEYYECLFCGVKGVGGHLMMYCPTVKDPKERMKIVRRLRRCTSCMSKNHRFSDCPSNKTCYCNQKHHTSLHYWFVQKPSGSQPQGYRNQQNEPQRGQQQGGYRPQGNQNNAPRGNAPQQAQSTQNRPQNHSKGNDAGRA